MSLEDGLPNEGARKGKGGQKDAFFSAEGEINREQFKNFFETMLQNLQALESDKRPVGEKVKVFIDFKQIIKGISWFVENSLSKFTFVGEEYKPSANWGSKFIDHAWQGSYSFITQVFQANALLEKTFNPDDQQLNEPQRAQFEDLRKLRQTISSLSEGLRQILKKLGIEPAPIKLLEPAPQGWEINKDHVVHAGDFYEEVGGNRFTQDPEIQRCVIAAARVHEHSTITGVYSWGYRANGGSRVKPSTLITYSAAEFGG